MTKVLELPHDLAERIEAEQISDTVLVQAVRRAVEQQTFRKAALSGASGAAKAEAFQAWAASHRDIRAVVLDDSREAIYQIS